MYRIPGWLEIMEPVAGPESVELRAARRIGRRCHLQPWAARRKSGADIGGPKLFETTAPDKMAVGGGWLVEIEIVDSVCFEMQRPPARRNALLGGLQIRDRLVEALARKGPTWETGS